MNLERTVTLRAIAPVIVAGKHLTEVILFPSQRFYRKHAVICLATILWCWCAFLPDAHASILVNSTPVVRYQVVDLQANFDSDGKLIDVTGGIKNYSYCPIRGSVIIYLLDSNQSVINGVETTVNNGISFDRGQTGTFEAVLSGAGNNVSSVSVEFVKK